MLIFIVTPQSLGTERTGRTKRTFQNLLSGFSQKTLRGKGGYTPPPPLTESPLSFSGNFFLEGLKMMFFSLNKVKNGPKRQYNGPERAKNA